jgi:hypothetical protein
MRWPFPTLGFYLQINVSILVWVVTQYTQERIAYVCLHAPVEESDSSNAVWLALVRASRSSESCVAVRTCKHATVDTKYGHFLHHSCQCSVTANGKHRSVPVTLCQGHEAHLYLEPAVFCHVAPRSLAEAEQRFRGAYRLHHQGDKQTVRGAKHH